MSGDRCWVTGGSQSVWATVIGGYTCVINNNAAKMVQKCLSSWIMFGRNSKLLLNVKKLSGKTLSGIVLFLTELRVGNRKSANFRENTNKTIRKCHTISH